jgi:hypothetical protein
MAPAARSDHHTPKIYYLGVAARRSVLDAVAHASDRRSKRSSACSRSSPREPAPVGLVLVASSHGVTGFASRVGGLRGAMSSER